MSQKETIRHWAKTRPETIQELLIEFPPGAKVKTKPGVELMVPAPGVVGEVFSLYEDGLVGVVASMAKSITSPFTGITLEEGEAIKGKCRAEDLEVVEYGRLTDDGTEVTPDFIRGLLA